MTTSTGKASTITLNNGVELPVLGLGVLLSRPNETAQAVETAINVGYRLIDTAAMYNNEREVGEGIRRSGIDRGELFVTTKLWLSDFGFDSALRAFDLSLKKLGLDYVDLYLIHWPVPSSFENTVAAYKALEKLLQEGRVRAIGVSNFKESHLNDLLERTEVVPAVNQVELSPFFAQPDIRETDRPLGIVTQSWSPIGGVYDRYKAITPDGARNPMEHPTVVGLAEKHGKTPAQVVLRWHVEHGLSAIPKSVRADRIAENIDIFDFSLAPEEVAAIDKLDTGHRAGPDPDVAHAGTWQVTIGD